MGSNRGKKKNKKRHRPVTAPAVRLKAGKEKKKSAALISKLHQLNKEKELINNAKLAKRQKAARINEIQKEVTALGGVQLYQHLSKAAESRHGKFNSAKWVMHQIHSLELWDPKKEPLRLLDVGALDFNYKGHEKVVNCTPIDLNPQKPGIIQADFLTFQKKMSSLYDVIVLSLVLNFAGSFLSRGDMLRTAHRLCKVDGYVVVVLPLACFKNSRYMDDGHFTEMMTSLGFDLITSHDSWKISFKLFKKTDRPQERRNFPKRVLRSGGGRNNFSIVLKW